MQLPSNLHERLSGELRYATGKMAEVGSPVEKLFYFSAIFGEIGRILNLHWDKDLVLIWSVFQHTHGAVSSRLQSLAQGDISVSLPEEFFNALTQETENLTKYVEELGDESSLCQILGRIAELLYMTTGNGYYLFGKGYIQL